MARIFMGGNEYLDYRGDGWTDYTAVTSAFQPVINQLNGAPTPNAYGGRGAYYFPNSTGIVYDFTPDFPAGLSEVWLRWHHAVPGGQNSSRVFMRFLDPSNNVTHEIRMGDAGGWGNASGAGSFQYLAYNGTATVNYANTTGLNTARGILSGTTWYTTELHLKIAGSGGQVEWMVDGVNNGGIFTGSTLGPLGQGVFHKIALCSINLGGTPNYWYVDDFAVNDPTGTFNNTWCGDGYIMPFDPSAPGSFSQLTNAYGTSVNNFNHVNRPSYQGGYTANSQVTYVKGFGAANPNYFVGTNVVGQKDTYRYTLPPVEFSSVRAIQVTANAVRNGPSITKAQMVVTPPSQAEILTPAAGLTLPTGQFGYVKKLLDINPNTSLPFTITELSSIEAGIKLNA